MNVFTAVKAVNLLYMACILAIAIFNNLIQTESKSSLQDGLLVILVVLFFSIPNIFSVIATPPRCKLAKTAIALNVVCIASFVAGLVALEQERLTIHWGVTVISICAINVGTLIQALANKGNVSPDSEPLISRF